MAPYYDAYGAPFINTARPYYDIIDGMVVTPLSTYGRKYGVPRLEQAREFGQIQWEKSLQPQVSKFWVAAQQQYAQTIAPYINKSVATAAPYYDIARDSALQTYYTTILPTWDILLPYAKHAYTVGNDFTVNTGIPYAKWAWSTSIIFLNNTVWPKLRIIYGENVEPQLIRIGERLGRYRDGKKLKAAVDEIDLHSYSSVSSISSSMSSPITSTQATTAVHGSTKPLSSSITSIPSPANTPSEQEVRAKAQRIVAEDLRNLQEKFAKAADEGSDELEAQITEITDRFMHNQVRDVGEAYLIQLEECINVEIENLKRTILSLIKKSNIEASEADLIGAVRKAGVTIKNKAQAVRVWRRNYDIEMASLVSKAVTETFEIIDHIRDLGLQEIGMRWAWMDGVTHKDWSKYHAMKNRFDEWRQDVEDIATNHTGLGKAREASDDVEDKAMTMAADAAKELSRLKAVGRWKLSAGDFTDDFSEKSMSAVTKAAGQRFLEQKSDVNKDIVDSTQGAVESFGSTVSASIAETLSSASSAEEFQLQKGKKYMSEPNESANSRISSISSSHLQTSIESEAPTPKDVSNSLDADASTLVDSRPNVMEQASSEQSIESGALEAVVGEAGSPTLLLKSSNTVESEYSTSSSLNYVEPSDSTIAPERD